MLPVDLFPEQALQTDLDESVLKRAATPVMVVVPEQTQKNPEKDSLKPHPTQCYFQHLENTTPPS
jgi:hypothetical protein